MISLLALAVFGAVLFALFRLDRNDAYVSKAIWVSVFWLSICCTRPISAWITLNVPGNIGDEYIEGSPLDRNILTLLLIAAVYILAGRRRQVHAIIKANPAIVAYLIFCLISLLWADYPFVVFKRWIRSVADIAMVLIVLTERNSLDALKCLLKRIGFVVVPLSIVLIRFFPALGRSYSRGGAPEWTGVGTDKNALGAICMIFGVFLIWRWIATYSKRKSKQRTRSLIAIGAVFAMILYLLFVVDSQTALSCFGMASILIIVTALSPRWRKPVPLTSLVAGMVMFCFSILILGIGSTLLKLLGRNPTLTGRTEVWQTVLPYAVNPWIGAGYENFWIGERMELFNRLLGGLNQAHNGYIEIYLNIGFIGLALLAGIIVTGYRNVLKQFRSDHETASLKVAFFVICLIYNFTEASFKMMSPVWITFLWAVILVPKPRLAAAPFTGVRQIEKIPVGAAQWQHTVQDVVPEPKLKRGRTLRKSIKVAARKHFRNDYSAQA
jgi:exopolysaccharide production protein ExoQ